MIWYHTSVFSYQIERPEIDHGLNLSNHNYGHLVQWKCDVPTAVCTIDRRSRRCTNDSTTGLMFGLLSLASSAGSNGGQAAPSTTRQIAVCILHAGVTLLFKQDKHRDRTEDTECVVEKLQERRGKEKLEEGRQI